MKFGLWLSLVLLPNLAICAPVTLLGTWQHRDYDLEFNGFLQAYACDQLEEKLEILLRAASARADMHIMTTCRFPDRPSEGAEAHIEFYALVPSADTSGNSAPGPESGQVAAQWRKVKLRYGSPSDLKATDCELLVHFKEQLLALFTVRDVVDCTHCTLGEAHPGDLDLQFEALALAGPN